MLLAFPSGSKTERRNSHYNEHLIGSTSSEILDLLELSYEYIFSEKEVIIKKYGKEQYGVLIKTAIWFSKSQLYFEDFYRFPEIRNSFHTFFRWGFIPREAYQSREFYKRFARENIDLNNELFEIFREGIYSPRIKYQARLLYQAYCIMLSYEETKSNEDLFK